jgi:hypothetical protein
LSLRILSDPLLIFLLFRFIFLFDFPYCLLSTQQTCQKPNRKLPPPLPLRLRSEASLRNVVNEADHAAVLHLLAKSLVKRRRPTLKRVRMLLLRRRGFICAKHDSMLIYHVLFALHDVGRLFVGNLSWNSTNESLQQVFEKYGKCTDVHIATDRETGRSRSVHSIRVSYHLHARAHVVHVRM